MFKSWSRAAVIAAAMLSLTPKTSWAATVVNVSMFDKGAAAAMAGGLGYGTPGIDMSKASMWMKLSTDSAKAGVVTFKVTNNSKDTVHEMIVIPVKNVNQPLPYDEEENRVDEDKAGHMGEVEELKPGSSGSLTVALKPGHYLLICNVPGHFGAGMWKEFNVTE